MNPGTRTVEWLTPAERLACETRHALRIAAAITRSAQQLDISTQLYVEQLRRRENPMRLSERILTNAEEVI